MIYVCDKCGSKFVNIDDACPVCKSEKIHKDMEYKQMVDDIERLITDLGLQKDKIDVLQNRYRNLLSDFKPIVMSDIIEDIREVRNNLNTYIEELGEYYG